MALDFEEAEKKAKEEADRIAKLGYNPDEETEPAAASSFKSAIPAEENKIAAPTPTSPTRGFGPSKERSNAEMSRLGMGMGRLGFGQTAGAKAAPQAKKMSGFGSTSRAVEGTSLYQFHNP